ncbi:hypothetical protein HMPREF0063_10033 [Aeromicrobium marinum DSM 15272]|uniref:Uncharacterized protein n=2 Tax=Aeromicrobium marinum TaxID=219314 RepID=E2S7M6_9ACTN|nr:hypothetical protein HMPREF0063_10033 [Aeromicrobium marinum DSM 15272]
MSLLGGTIPLMPDRDRILAAKIGGTARRLATTAVPQDQAVTQMRTLAGDRTDLLTSELGAILGGYLARPIYAEALATAHLLAVAIGVPETGPMVEAFDRARDAATRGGYSHRQGT